MVGEVGMKKDYIVELREEEADELIDEHWVGELTRCKDCKYCTIAADKKWRQSFEKSIYECDHMNLNFVEPDWFCADGERR